MPKLERLIRPSGYFRQKAKRLKGFIAFLDKEYAGSVTRLFARPTSKLRAELLALNGVGPETADCILLYAGNHPVFVVDAYARRILDRHQILPGKSNYDKIRQLFERALPPIVNEESSLDMQLKVEPDAPGAAHPPSPMSTAPRPAVAQVYNEMHALTSAS